jgi:hypothetical protein
MITASDFMKEAITDTAFAGLADIVIERNAPIDDNAINRMKRDNCVIFCQTSAEPKLFEIMKALAEDCKKYVLITHRSDYEVDSTRYDRKHPAVIKWYATNVNITKPDLIPIPLGMESPGCLGYSDHPEVLLRIMQEPKTIKNLAYLNFSRTTQPERTKFAEHFEKYPWVTVKHKIPLENFIRDLYSHDFVFSPEGHGRDAHKTWEALYMGAVPIVQDSILTRSFSDLPIAIVGSDLSVITKKYLENILPEVKRNSCDKIKISYWKNRIEQDKRDLK